MKKEGLNRLAVSAGIMLIGVIVGFIIASDFGVFSRFKTPSIIAQEVSPAPADDLMAPPVRQDQIFIKAARQVTKAVVNISTTKTVENLQENPLFNDPFFRRFFGDEFRHNMPRQRKEQSLGSGVIVDAGGYIITNHHVVDKADQIKIYTLDKKEYMAKLIGSDEKMDIAVLKIEGENFPTITWGDSDKLEIGEYVLAVGNPFGLSQTVTMGIVSAVGRSNVGIADYEDFIQTDAAINPGNSGGALVNVSGDLVGINTAIYSQSGGYMGIGFAVPSNMVRTAMQSLIKHGKVIRGWLGVSIQEITPELARQFDLKEISGALVSEVLKGGPAEKAGIKRGDVITSLNGDRVKDITHLRNKIAGTPVGESLEVEVMREGKGKKIKVKIGDLAESEKKGEKRSGSVEEEGSPLAGVVVEEISPEIRQELGLTMDESGVIISSVELDSIAAEAGLSPLDVIQEINRHEIKNLNDYSNIVSKLKKDQTILMLVKRKERTLFVTITPPSK